MKKTLALTLAVLMILTSFTAFADDFDDLYEIIEKTTENSKMLYTVSFELNDTLDFLKTYKIPYMEFIDTYHLTEDLLKSKSEVNAKIISSNNLKKADMYMDITFNAPVTVNPDLKFGVWGKMYYWITYDFTDEFNPVLKYIMKMPTSDKYQVLDYSKSPEMTEMLSAVNYGEILDASKEILKKYSTVKKTKDGYTMNITSENAKLFMFDILDNVSGAYGNEFVELMDVADPFEEMKEYFNENNIFGEDGITATFNIDKKGNIYKGTETIDLAVSFPLYNGETGEETTETIKCKIYTDFKCEKDSSLISIDFPELTEENSIDLLDANGGYEPRDYICVCFDGVPYIESNTKYYPLRPVLNEFNVENENINWENGYITITSNDEYTGFYELKLNAGNDEVIKDGVAITVENGVREYNDTTYISEDFINRVLDSEVYSPATYYNDNGSTYTYVDISRISFTDTLDYDYDETEYYSFTDYGYPYNDGEMYIPYNLFIENTGEEIDWSAVVYHNGKDYIPLSYITDNLGYQLDYFSFYFEDFTPCSNYGFTK